MPVLNPEHLFDQADRLSNSLGAGAPRQVDLRRAVSATYYGLFHFTMSSAADELIGKKHRASIRYALIYRGIDHRGLREFCIECQKSTPQKKFAPFFPHGGFASEIQDFATAVIDLQAKRHRADYDPLPQFKTSDVELAIAAARSAIRRFMRAQSEHRKLFLTLLVCSPR